MARRRRRHRRPAGAARRRYWRRHRGHARVHNVRARRRRMRTSKSRRWWRNEKERAAARRVTLGRRRRWRRFRRPARAGHRYYMSAEHRAVAAAGRRGYTVTRNGCVGENERSVSIRRHHLPRRLTADPVSRGRRRAAVRIIQRVKHP